VEPINPKLASLLLLLSLFLVIPTTGVAFILIWTDTADNETGFKIERKSGTTGTFAEVGQVGANIETFTNATPDSQVYCYQVRAFNAAGDSAYSNEACGTGLISAPEELAVTP